MHGYETKELQEGHLAALADARASAAARLAHAQEELEAGAAGPQKAYQERIAERAEAEVKACDAELRSFSSKAKTKRARASKRST